MKSFREFILESERLIVYRGITTNNLEHAMVGRPDYNVFASTNPWLALSYAGEDGTVYAFDISGMELIDFPVPIGKFGPKFDMFEFDRAAKRLKPNTVLVARGVYDAGPRGTTRNDPERLYSYKSDIYAIGNGTNLTVDSEWTP